MICVSMRSVSAGLSGPVAQWVQGAIHADARHDAGLEVQV
jgi:hypothetical protein